MLPKIFHAAAGWLFTIAIICAPFLYGGTTDPAIHILNSLLLTACALWLCGLIAERRMPHGHTPIWGAVLVLLCQGWWMTINARAIHDSEFWQFAPFPPLASWLPGSCDRNGSQTTMIRLSALLPSLLAIMDLAQRTRWVKRFQWSMATAGATLSALGIWQKLAYQPLRIWPVEHVSSYTFATFWYHGNAAAFLNTTWPLTLGASACAFLFGSSHVLRSIWIGAFLMILSGLAVNVSKAGHAIAVLIVLATVGLSLLRLRTILVKYGWKQVTAASGIGITILLWLLMQLDNSETIKRWKQFLDREKWDLRFEVAGQCLDMLPDTGWFGSGPGTFAATHHHYLQQHSLDSSLGWKYAHNDYLQAAVEWGLPGSLAWLIIWGSAAAAGTAQIWRLIKPAFVQTKRRSRQSRERWRRSKEALLQVLMISATGSLATLLLHAAIDFPLQIYATQIYGLFLAGMLLANQRGVTNRQRTDTSHPRGPKKSVEERPTGAHRC